MSRWREVAQRLKEQEGGGDVRDVRDNSPLKAPIVPIVPIVPRGLSQNQCITPADWQTALARLDAYQPPASISLDRWTVLVHDARWLASTNSASAFALGWNASDLFGLSDHAGEGGLADRLHGADHVAFTDTVAHWRSEVLDGWLWRKSLRPMPTIWEVASA